MLAGGLGASPLDLNVNEYGISGLFRTIEQGGSAGTIASPSRTI
ncbi:hypothetical protein bcgnr5394_56020 [Bacillus cereus]|nr:hypothetical protein WHT_58740 [Bacillus cereus]